MCECHATDTERSLTINKHRMIRRDDDAGKKKQATDATKSMLGPEGVQLGHFPDSRQRDNSRAMTEPELFK